MTISRRMQEGAGQEISICGFWSNYKLILKEAFFWNILYLISILRKCNYCQYRTIDTKYLRSLKSKHFREKCLSCNAWVSKDSQFIAGNTKVPPILKVKGQRSSSKGLFQKLKLIMHIERPLCLTSNYAAFAPMNEVSNMSITTTT